MAKKTPPDMTMPEITEAQKLANITDAMAELDEAATLVARRQELLKDARVDLGEKREGLHGLIHEARDGLVLFKDKAVAKDDAEGAEAIDPGATEGRS